MIDQPISLKNFTPVNQQFRAKDDATKMLGSAIFKNKNFLTEKQRIQQSLDRNSYFYDTEPNVKPVPIHDFRERNTSKEIQPKMRFTAATQIERIIESINQNPNGSNSISQAQIKKNLNHFNKVQTSLQNQVQNPKNDQKKQPFSVLTNKRNQKPLIEDDDETKGKDPTEALFKGGLTKKGKLLTFYSTASQGKMQVAVSQFMLQNIYVAKTLNRNKKKMHFKAAQSVHMQHQGVLRNQSVNLRHGQINTPKQSAGDLNPYSLRSTQRNFYPQLEDKQLNVSKSAFYLPLKKESYKSMNSLGLTKEIQNSQSTTSLPKVLNPLVVSKEKQNFMIKYLDEKSLNPYEVKQRKKQRLSNLDKQKIDTLMSTSYLNSSYFNAFYKDAEAKKIRFNINKLELDDISKEDIAQQEVKEENPFGLKKFQSNKEDKAKLKIQGMMKQIQRSRDKVEDAAYEILTGCNAIVDKNISAHKYLKKGDGKLVGGSGLTNYMVYDNLVKTL